MKRFLSTFFIVFGLLLNTMYGQDEDECTKWIFGVDFDILNPIQELGTNGFENNPGMNIDILRLGFERNQIAFQPGFRIRGGGSVSESQIEFIADPINQDAIREVNNLTFDAKFVGRILWNQFYQFQPYVEADMGVRFAGANENITTLGESIDSFDSSEFVVKGFSGTYGFGAGFLIRVTERIKLNIRYNIDLTNSMSHLNFNTFFPFEEVRTSNAVNQRFAIGFVIHHFDCDNAGLDSNSQD